MTLITMRKIISAFTLLVLVFGSQTVQAEGVQFEHGSWGEALKKAQKEDKIIFLDAYTTWCGPCKWMSANVMTQPEVGKFYNDNFVNVKMDMEKGEGVDLAKKYKVGAYPTLAFINGKGEMVWRVAGALEAKEFIALGQKILNGVEPVQKMYDQYATGKFDKDFLYKYLVHTQEAAMPSNEPLLKYVEMMEPSDLENERDFDVFVRFFQKTDSEFFKEFEKNLDKYREMHGADVVNKKYFGMFMSSMKMAAYNDDQKAFKANMNKIGDRGGEEIQGEVNSLVVYNLIRNKTKDEAYAAINEFVEAGKPFPAHGLNYYAWDIYENSDDPAMIEQAVKWAETAVEATNDPMILDTYGMLLYKSGEKEMAIEKLEEALRVAESENVDMEETKKALEKMKAEN